MNRKNYSRDEIKEKIRDSLRGDTVSELLVSITSFCDSISGKELINKREILRMIIDEVDIQRTRKNLEYIKAGKRIGKNIFNELLLCDQFRDLFPRKELYTTGYLRAITMPEKKMRNLYKGLPVANLLERLSVMNTFRDKIPLDIVFTCNSFDKYRKSKLPPDTAFKEIEKENKAFGKLRKFIGENPDVGELLHDYVEESKRDFLALLIKEKKIKETAMLIFFDSDLSIKKNTIRLHKLLKPEISAINIDKTIRRKQKEISRGDYNSFKYPKCLK